MTLTTINEIQQKKLLTNGSEPAGVYDFWGLDTQKRYLQNSRSQPSDWPWHDQPVKYTVNTQNYRAPEWDQIDWAQSIAIYGCSFVFGDGVNDSDTIAAHLERIMARPVINLGAGGSSPQWQLANQTLVQAHFTEPWATITIWPSADRAVSYDQVRGANKWGSWSMARHGWTDLWNQGGNPGTQMWMTREQSRMMHRRRWIDASYHKDVADVTGCPSLGDLVEFPTARDGAHYGPNTHKQVAEFLSKMLST